MINNNNYHLITSDTSLSLDLQQVRVISMTKWAVEIGLENASEQIAMEVS